MTHILRSLHFTRISRALWLSSAIIALASPAAAAGNSTSIAPPPSGFHGTVACHGIQTVPMTADAVQALPMQVIATLNCGDELAILNDEGGYTVHVRTAQGKNGYVARMYLAEDSADHSSAKSSDSPVSAAAEDGISRWRAGDPGCDHFFVGDSLIESLTASGVTVQVSLQDTGWKLRAEVAVVNGTSASLNFDPAAFTLDELTPRLISLPYQNPRHLAKEANHQVLWTSVNATAPGVPSARSAAASQAYVFVSYRPPVNTHSVPNYLPEPQTQDSTAAAIKAAALQPHSLATRGMVSGVVWFQRDKNSQALNLRVFVGGQIFEFPFSFNRPN